MIHEVQLSSRYALQDQPRETPGTRANLTHDRVWPQVGERGCLEQRPGGIPAQRGLFEIVYVHPQSAGSLEIARETLGSFAEDSVADFEPEWSQRHTCTGGHHVAQAAHRTLLSGSSTFAPHRSQAARTSTAPLRWSGR